MSTLCSIFGYVDKTMEKYEKQNKTNVFLTYFLQHNALNHPPFLTQSCCHFLS